MSLQIRLSDLITAIGTDYKALRTFMFGTSTGTLTSLTTTDKTSLVAAINETKAGNSGAPPAATTAVQGTVLLATDAMTVTGTDTTHATTPANTAAAISARIDNTATLGTSTVNAPSQLAVKTYADALIGANDAMVFKGVIDASTSPVYPASNRGDTYKISVAGKIGGASGPNVEVGDTLMALTDATPGGTQAAVGAQWNILQANIDGAVVGPASAFANNFVSFSGTTGKVVQDSLISLDLDGALSANSANRIPSQSAVKAYAQPLDTDLSSIAALTTTTYGRAFLTLAAQSNLMALLVVATTAVQGIIQLATQTEVNTGTDANKAVTPATLAGNITLNFGVPDTDLVALYTTAKT